MTGTSIAALAAILVMFAFFSAVLLYALHVAPPTFPNDKPRSAPTPARADRTPHGAVGAH